MKIQVILLFLFAFPFAETRAQSPIELKNPSFESDRSDAGVVPSGWINLGDDMQTPPDIQPGFFQVELPAQDGKTYLGLVVRQSNTCEGVGQRLSGYLEKDTGYTFSLWLTRSNVYRSPILGTTEPVNFNAPTILKIWGYNTRTKQEELLAESQPVGHSKWVRYGFVLTPSLADYDEIDLMAYYAPGQEGKNGNLLIDNCSNIVKISK